MDCLLTSFTVRRVEPEPFSQIFNIIYIQPGKPTQNGYIERFNGSYRRAVLDRYIFRNISEVRELTEAWRKDYNEERPHEALDNMTPFEYREELIKRKEAV